jgi:hypothetical protein
VARVTATIEMGRELIKRWPPRVIADLSCGDAAIPRALVADENMPPARRVILGDIAPGYEMYGPIEQTIFQVQDVGLFVCCETIEHLDDPDWVLAVIRDRAETLLLSTPLNEKPGINPEHYWAWDQDGVRLMLAHAGWKPVLESTSVTRDGNDWPWAYQLWGCR